MARRYSRDNRGRFSGGGGGATRRGGRLRTAAGNKRATVTAKAKGPGMAGAVKGRIKRDPGAMAKAGKASGPSSSRKGGKRKIDDAKVSRVSSRVNSVVRGAERKSGVRRMNATEVGARAKSFLARKAGGVGMLNQMSQKDRSGALASVRKAMAKPPKYSTQKPNRNKPTRFNALGQDKARAKARADAMTGRERIAQANLSAARKTSTAKASARTSTNAGKRRASTATSRRDLSYSIAPGRARAKSPSGVVTRKPAAPKASPLVARTRGKARAAQRFRKGAVLDRGRTGLGNNPRIKRSDTGMSQLSLVGKAKPLYSFRRVRR